MPGYRLRLKDEVNPRYLCVHCLLLLKDAVLTACGHFYCESCVDLLFRNPEAPPACKACRDGDIINKDRVIPDVNTRQEVLSMVCACTFCNEGCPWKGQVRHYEHHTAMCGFCQVKCDNSQCNVFVRRDDLSRHMTQQCKYRIVVCDFCDRRIPHNLLKTHVECEHSVQLQDDPERGQEEIVSSDNILDAHEHLNLHNVPNSIQNAQDGTDLQDKVRQLEENQVRLRDVVQQLQNQVNLLENRQVELLRSHDEQKIVLHLDRNENENAQLRMERRMQESIEHTLALRNVTLDDLKEYVRQQECSSCDGVLLWKISEYSRKRNEAVIGQQVSFHSPSFYTSRYGYKMCARIYLNGDGMGRGTHISVFFVVMRGQYDALLRWPFRQKVTFMLLDQDNVEHVIDAFRPDPSSSSFQRPRRETNIASGCPMFCSLTELNNHAYVRDDTMILKIIVDTSDL